MTAGSRRPSAPGWWWGGSRSCWVGGFSRERLMSSPTRSDAPVVLVEGVTVRYRLPTQTGLTLQEYAIHRLLRRVTYRTIDALADVSVAVYAGESLAII